MLAGQELVPNIALEMGASLGLHGMADPPIEAAAAVGFRLAGLPADAGAIPPAPMSLADTGIALPDLIDLLAKTMLSGAVDTVARLADEMKLPPRLVGDLLQEASSRMLVEALGVGPGGIGAGRGPIRQPRYALSARGRDWAHQAMQRNGYVGPVPVPLNDFAARIRRQAIHGERVPPGAVARALAGLVGVERLIAQIGPAINSGRAMLLYGPAGNGKSTLARLVGSIFQGIVHVPYCFEIGGQIVRVFDPDIHREVASPEEALRTANPTSIRARGMDARWVPCHRPFVVTGGELTLEMLELGYNPVTRFYEAPLHVKAMNGVFLIDDFGRQLVRPEVLLNRWIVPMESRVDYLRLQTGKSFSLPFDALVMFSTNAGPEALIDAAFMRRIPYKIEVPAPDPQEFATIFRKVSESQGMHASDASVRFVVREIAERRGLPLAGFQPGFILDQVMAACRFHGVAPQLEEGVLLAAIDNLHTRAAG